MTIYIKLTNINKMAMYTAITDEALMTEFSPSVPVPLPEVIQVLEKGSHLPDLQWLC